MSDINIVMAVLMPDNIDYLGFSSGGIVEKPTADPERFRLNIAVVPEESPVTVKSDGQCNAASLSLVFSSNLRMMERILSVFQVFVIVDIGETPFMSTVSYYAA